MENARVDRRVENAGVENEGAIKMESRKKEKYKTPVVYSHGKKLKNSPDRGLRSSPHLDRDLG